MKGKKVAVNNSTRWRSDDFAWEIIQKECKRKRPEMHTEVSLYGSGGYLYSIDGETKEKYIENGKGDRIPYTEPVSFLTKIKSLLKIIRNK